MAPPDSRQLTADVRDLYNAGAQELPSLAGVFESALGELAHADNGLDDAFSRPDLFGPLTAVEELGLGGRNLDSTGAGPAYLPWLALREALEVKLAEMSTNLELTGQALRLAAQEYARSDHAAEEEVKRLEKENLWSRTTEI